MFSGPYESNAGCGILPCIDNKIDREIDASASAVRKYFRLYQICYSLFVDK